MKNKKDCNKLGGIKSISVTDLEGNELKLQSQNKTSDALKKLLSIPAHIFVLKDGEYYCLTCKKPASEAHPFKNEG